MSGPMKRPPAPFDARQLAETVDTMALLIASLSDRIDAQGRILEKVHQTATEARMAAFAAERATDWERNGDFINEGIARGTRQADRLMELMLNQLEAMNRVMDEMLPLIAITTPRELKRRERLERLRRWMPWLLGGMFLLGAAVVRLAVALGWLG